MLCIGLYNSYVLWRERALDPTSQTYLQHLQAVADRWTSLRSHPEGTDAAEQLVTPTHHQPFSYEGYRTRKDDPECRLTARMDGHFLAELPQVGKKTNPTRPCRVCLKQAEVKASQAAAAAATAAATGSDSAGGGGKKKKKKTTTPTPEKKNRQESRYFCKRCLVPLHSMPKRCFEIYHTKKNYAHV